MRALRIPLTLDMSTTQIKTIQGVPKPLLNPYFCTNRSPLLQMQRDSSIRDTDHKYNNPQMDILAIYYSGEELNLLCRYNDIANQKQLVSGIVLLSIAVLILLTIIYQLVQILKL